MGDLKILELMQVTQAAAYYKAERVDADNKHTTYLMKVAAPGTVYSEHLKNEARTLQQIIQKFGSSLPTSLPTLMPHGAANGADPFGYVHAYGQERYYMLFDYRPGEFLHDILLDNPQPWHQHVGWFIISLIDAVNAVHTAGHLHLNLNPGNIYVFKNNLGVPQPILMDMGLNIAFNKVLSTEDARRYFPLMHPAYRPREMLATDALTPASDVYCIGLILYEMLAGEPGYPYQLKSSGEVARDIRMENVNLLRDDLPIRPRRGNRRNDTRQVEPLKHVVERSIQRTQQGSGQRYDKPSRLRQALVNIYGEVEDKPDFSWSRQFMRGSRVVAVGGAGCVVIFALVLLILAFGYTTLPTLPV